MLFKVLSVRSYVRKSNTFSLLETEEFYKLQYFFHLICNKSVKQQCVSVCVCVLRYIYAINSEASLITSSPARSLACTRSQP